MPANDHSYSLIQRDPSAVFGSISALVAAGLTLLVAFGVDLTEEQSAAILGFVAVAGPVVTALLIRSKAFSPATHLEQVETALYTPPPPPPL